jgi:hypothetical protein
MKLQRSTIGTAAGLALLASSTAFAGSHLWRINELYSNADGTIQFIEMKECCGAANERFIANRWVSSATTGNQFVFPENLPPDSTANKHLLLATAGFAAQPGAPTPDYIIADGFIDLDHDTIQYWTYTAAQLTFTSGELPLDGVNSLVCTFNDASGCVTYEPQVNSPTNFQNESGSIVVPCTAADLDLSGGVEIGDLLELLANWGPCVGCDADLTGDDEVGIEDLLDLLASWGPC